MGSFWNFSGGTEHRTGEGRQRWEDGGHRADILIVICPSSVNQVSSHLLAQGYLQM